MLNKKTKNDENAKTLSVEAKKLSAEEIRSVSGGMKIVAEEEEESSWFKSLVDLFFKIK